MKNLITLALQLAEQHPELATRIEKGAIVALTGNVRTEPAHVSGLPPTKYNTSLWLTAPGGAKWQCDCIDATIGNAPHIDDFLGGSGKVCKHIIALALVKEAGNLTPVKNVFEWLVRIVESGWVDAFGIGMGIKGGVTLRPDLILIREPKRERLILKSGAVCSRALVTYEGGAWVMNDKAEDYYNEFVSELQGVNNE